MGRFSKDLSLRDQFDNSIPRSVAETLYQQRVIKSAGNSTDREAWVKNHSFNTDTYEEIFTLPDTSPSGKQYYAITFGDIRLVVLYITNMWRAPNLSANVRESIKSASRI